MALRTNVFKKLLMELSFLSEALQKLERKYNLFIRTIHICFIKRTRAQKIWFFLVFLAIASKLK